MKKFNFIILACGLATACTRPQYNEEAVISETYVHEYGVEVQPDDWSSRGQSGQIISTLANGVQIKKNFTQGNLHGEVTYSFPHSDVVEKTEYYDNNNLVRVVVNNSQGTPVKETAYQSPENYTVKIWYDNGAPQSVETYSRGGLVDGSYFTQNNQLEGRVINGEGAKIERDHFGQLIANNTVVNGQITQRKTFYPNGAPKEIIEMVNGQPNGVKKMFTSTGEPDQHQTLNNGIQNGITTHFRNGEKYSEVTYENGNMTGVERRYKGDAVVEEITWRNGVRHGPDTIHTGDTVRTDWYFNNRPVTAQQFVQMSHGETTTIN